METSKSNYSSLASYAVIKTLTDSKKYKNSYQVLTEFIKYIITDKKIHKFSLIDIDNELQMEFGFNNIPLPAIKTSLKQIDGCTKNGDDYYFHDNLNFEKDEFEKVQQASFQRSQEVINRLHDFAKTKCSYEGTREDLEEAFIKYLLDDAATIDQRYSDIISKFILSIDKDELLKESIIEIREGSIVFCGLAYNINEIGSITSDLTLFLDTEVLFNIVGYNGTLHKRFSEDFLNQVKRANVKTQRIKLRYFSENYDEIKRLFNSAERAIEGHGDLIRTTAMESILNGCESVGDVRDKEADFFYALQFHFGILQDKKTSYYGPDDYKFNIESIPPGYPNDDKSYEAVRFISHINVLRQGKTATEYTDSKYLFITETKRIQEISNSMVETNHMCGYALPTSVITNNLWFKLGFGFSKEEYPINTDVSYKARFILSGEIANKIARLYEETKQQYKDGVINREQVASRIVLMREKSKCPDEITSDCSNEDFDFSPEYIARFEEGVKFNVTQIEKSKRIIDKLEESNQAFEIRNEKLTAQLDSTCQELDSYRYADAEKQNTIIEQETELIKLRDESRRHEMEKKKAELRKRLTKGIVLKIIVLIVFLVVLRFIFIIYSIEDQNGAYSMNIISVLLGLGSIYKSDWEKYKGDMKKVTDSSEPY